MRVFPHWVVRFGVIAIAPIPVVAMLLTPDEWRAAHWGAVALALLFVAAGARAVIGGVEATAAEYIVRNPLRTRRIPRHEVAGFTQMNRRRVVASPCAPAAIRHTLGG